MARSSSSAASWTLSDAPRRIVFRIGIHLGDVVEESDGDLMGDGVNIAARLEGIALPGTICLNPRFSALFAFLAAALALADREDESASTARRLLELEPKFQARNLIGVMAGFASPEVASAWASGLRKAGLPELGDAPGGIGA